MPNPLYDAPVGFTFLLTWGLSMKTTYLIAAALGLATVTPPGLAETGDIQEAFQRSVQQAFVQNTIAGNWKTDCHILNDGSGSFIVEYLFTPGAEAVAVSTVYEDTSCLYLRDSQLVDGSATLTSLKVDSYGNYVYGLTVANQDASHALTFHLNLADSLTVLTSDTINQSFVMTKAE